MKFKIQNNLIDTEYISNITDVVSTIHGPDTSIGDNFAGKPYWRPTNDIGYDLTYGFFIYIYNTTKPLKIILFHPEPEKNTDELWGMNNKRKEVSLELKKEIERLHSEVVKLWNSTESSIIEVK